MDGAGRSVMWKDAVQPTSLVFSSNGEKIYWADKGTLIFVLAYDQKSWNGLSRYITLILVQVQGPSALSS